MSETTKRYDTGIGPFCASCGHLAHGDGSCAQCRNAGVVASMCVHPATPASVPPAGTPTRITAMMERYDGEPDTVCPGCGHKLHALRFEHGLRLRTYVCLWPKCSGYRSLVDEDDGDHGRGDDND